MHTVLRIRDDYPGSDSSSSKNEKVNLTYLVNNYFYFYVSKKETLSHVLFRKYIPRIGAKRKLIEFLLFFAVILKVKNKNIRIRIHWSEVRIRGFGSGYTSYLHDSGQDLDLPGLVLVLQDRLGRVVDTHPVAVAFEAQFPTSGCGLVSVRVHVTICTEDTVVGSVADPEPDSKKSQTFGLWTCTCR
jgi:hypothetical protein